MDDHDREIFNIMEAAYARNTLELARSMYLPLAAGFLSQLIQISGSAVESVYAYHQEGIEYRAVASVDGTGVSVCLYLGRSIW